MDGRDGGGLGPKGDCDVPCVRTFCEGGAKPRKRDCHSAVSGGGCLVVPGRCRRVRAVLVAFGVACPGPPKACEAGAHGGGPWMFSDSFNETLDRVKSR